MDKVKVIGAKWFKGNIDGKELNSGTLFIEERLDDRRGTAKGYAATPYKLSSSERAEALAKHGFPLECEVEFERMSNGKGDSENVIVAISPLVRPSPAVGAAAPSPAQRPA